MLVEVNISTNDESAYSTVKSILDMAAWRLTRRHPFVAQLWFNPRKDGAEKPKVLIGVVTEDDRAFSFAKDFIYWAFEDRRRKRGFEVDYSIKQIKIDPPSFLKGPGRGVKA